MGKKQYCVCGCGVTPTNYRNKFFDTWPNGYPYANSGKYYCSNYGCKDKNGRICNFIVSNKCSEAHVDHVVPKAHGGRNCISNLRIMCCHCNTSKNDTETFSSTKFQDNISANALKRYLQNKIK